MAFGRRLRRRAAAFSAASARSSAGPGTISKVVRSLYGLYRVEVYGTEIVIITKRGRSAIARSAFAVRGVTCPGTKIPENARAAGGDARTVPTRGPTRARSPIERSDGRPDAGRKTTGPRGPRGRVSRVA